MLYFNEDYTEAHPEYMHTDSDGFQSAWLYKHIERVCDAVCETHGAKRTLYVTCSDETVYGGAESILVVQPYSADALQDPNNTSLSTAYRNWLIAVALEIAELKEYIGKFLRQLSKKPKV